MTAATRRQLLDAGRRVFARQGLEGARVEAIAREAGVNKALINYHFRGKRGLYEAVLAELLADAEAALARGLAAVQAPAERLRAWPALLAAVLGELPDLAPLLLGEWLRAEGDAPLPGRELVAEAVSAAGVDRADPDALARLLLGGVVLGHLDAAPGERRAAREDSARLLAGLIERGLLAD